MATTPAAGQAGDPSVPWARPPARPDRPVTTRTRRIVESLPAWEPLPPGEILVERPRWP
jgi:hypothetical protein